MTISNTMTGLMDAARTKYPLVNKLKISDLTKLLYSTEISTTQLKMDSAFLDGKWYRYNEFNNPAQIYPQGDAWYINAKKGQTIFQAVDFKSDGKLNSAFISFYQKGVGHHNVVPESKVIDQDTIRLSAIYTCESDGEYLLMDLNGLATSNATYISLSNFYAAISKVGGVVKALLNALLPIKGVLA